MTVMFGLLYSVGFCPGSKKMIQYTTVFLNLCETAAR